MFKLNGIFRKGKSILPNPAPNLKLVFKRWEVERIKHIKGWRTDGEMAAALGITRAYVSMMSKRRVSVSHNVILRLAYLLGNLCGNWWVHYEIVDSGEPVDPNHPLWNHEKYEGRVPYSRFSPNAGIRRKDYRVEVRTYKQEFPIKKRLDKVKI
jgi:hypothetical protein